MIPQTLLGVVIFVVAVAPGYSYLRFAERRAPRPDRSRLMEAAELLGIGSALLAVASAATIGLGVRWPEVFVNLRAWAASGSQYLGDEPYRGLASVAAVLLIAHAAAYPLARLTHRGARASLHPAVSVWHQVLGEDIETTAKFLALQLRSGRVVEGYLRAYSIDTPLVDREISLQAPIFVTHDGQRQLIAATSMIFRGEDIAEIGVVDDPDHAPPQTGRQRA